MTTLHETAFDRTADLFAEFTPTDWVSYYVDAAAQAAQNARACRQRGRVKASQQWYAMARQLREMAAQYSTWPTS